MSKRVNFARRRPPAVVTEAGQPDPLLERAREDAQGSELLEAPKSGATREQEREAAQGTEVFEDPDAILPATVLKEGSPGHESLTGDGAGLGRDEAEHREEDED
ncbi:MAG TPA: hypothetical protein VMS99_03550 [Acidimicrobiia bacterium]|nr:hypothetical protein [Acidimicrobiia bacterium]